MKTLFSNSKNSTKLILFALIATSYFFLAVVGLQFATMSGKASPIWPATGLGIGLLYLFGESYFFSIFLGSILAEIFFAHANIITSSGLAVGSTLEALAGAFILRYLVRIRFAKNYNEVISTLISVPIASGISSFIGVSSLYFSKVITEKDYLYTIYTWWSGDFFGALIVLPLVLEIKRRIKEKKLGLGLKEWLIFILASIISVIILHFVFVEDGNQTFIWILCYLLLALGIYSNQMTARFLLIILSFFTVYLTLNGYSLLEFSDINLSFLYLQLIIGCYFLSCLISYPLRTSEVKKPKFIIPALSVAIFSAILIFILSKNEKEYTKRNIFFATSPIFEGIEQQKNNINIILLSTTNYLNTIKNINNINWKKYFLKLDLEKIIPSNHGIGFIKIVPKNKLSVFVQEQKKDRKMDFIIKSINENYSKLFDDKYIVQLKYPELENDYGFGLDVGSERIRREAADLSKKLRKSVSTTPIQIASEKNNKKLAYLIFNPVFDSLDKVIGWNYILINIEDFYKKILKNFKNNNHIGIYINNNIVYGEDILSKKLIRNSKFLSSKEIDFFGVKHGIYSYPSYNFFSTSQTFSIEICTLIILLYLISICFYSEMLTFVDKSNYLVQKRTKEIEENKAQLIHSSKMASLGEMAGGMAHEINSPLAIIMGKSSLLRRLLDRGNIDIEHFKNELKKIEQTTERISKIIQGLRAFSRNSESDSMENSNLKQIINDTVELCQERFKHDSIEIRIHCSETIFLQCKSSQISQILLNLLNNSADAIKKRNEKWIAIEASFNNNLITISVTDCGHGIANEIVAKMMEPFFTTKDVDKGTGLGLSISKGIAESHHGRLYYDPNYPNTRFILELPIVQPQKTN